MMNLDEAISHAREKAEENKKAASRFAYPDKAGTTKESADCLECAKEHEQLAEWLMELKKLREENVNQFLNSKNIILALIEENKALRKQRPQGDLISRSELIKAINDFYDEFFDGCFSSALITYAKGVDEIIENAQTVAVNCKECDGYEAGYSSELKDAERPQGNCENCDFRKFSEKFVDGVVELMNENGITSLEQLTEILKGGAE